jgi:hypothetical protein
MPLTTNENNAVTRLALYNSNNYDAGTNRYGLAGLGYKDADNSDLVGGKAGNYPQFLTDASTVTSAVARLAGEAETDAATASTAADTATGARDAAVVAKNAAEAAAASASFPFGVTAGTSTAYTLNFTPDQPTSAGSAFRVQFHTGCGNNPTLSVDGATAANLVNQAGQNLQSGDIATNRIYMIIYDAALSKWTVNNFVANEVLRSDETASLTVGYSAPSKNIGDSITSIISGGTVTPNVSNGQFQHYINGGAHTLAPPANDTVITVQITNNGSAGAITTSGFTRVTGDVFTTTNGHDFICDLRKINGFSQLNITAMQ